MENKFCFLKGLVDCESGRIQDCNMKRLNKCPLEEKKEEPKKNSTAGILLSERTGGL